MDRYNHLVKDTGTDDEETTAKRFKTHNLDVHTDKSSP